MWKTKIEPIGGKHILNIDATNYYSQNSKSFEDIEIRRAFDTIEEAKHYFIGCAHTFLVGSFEIFVKQLQAVAPIIFNGNVLHNLHRVEFIENWHSFLEFKEAFSSSGNSIWKKANLIIDQYELIYSVLPKSEALKYSYFLEFAKDILKSAAQLKRALGDRIELQKREWHEINGQDIEENYPLKREVA